MPPTDNDHQQDRISVVEDLDPESPQRSAPWRGRELVLGLLLLAGVLAWALGTWWHDSNASRNYYQAQQAANERRWDDALAGYSAASGYIDADSRAADAAKRVKDRDNQYQFVAAYEQALNSPQGASIKQAVLALPAARAVQTIEPGYKDADAMASKAEDQLSTAALSNMVALREQASPPGLYYRSPTEWLYLQGSDKQSTLFGTVWNDRIIYDVSAIDLTSDNAPTRPIMMAALSTDHTSLSFQPLGQKPPGHNSFQTSKHGMWIVTERNFSSYVPSNGDTMDFRADSFIYQAYGNSPVTGTVANVGADARIVSLGLEAGRMLVVASGPSVQGSPTTLLYAAGPDGSNARAIYSTTGALTSAFLSPDEHYAFVVSAEQDTAMPSQIIMTANLLDLESAGPQGAYTRTQLVQTTITGIMIPGDSVTDGVSVLSDGFYPKGIFLRDGAFKNELLFGWAEESNIHLRLIDPANPQAPLAESSMPYRNTVYYNAPVSLPATVQPDGHTLVVYDTEYPLTQATGTPGEPFTLPVKVFHIQDLTGTMAVSDYTISLPDTYVHGDTVPYLTSFQWSATGLVFEITTTIENAFYGVPGSGPDSPTTAQPVPIINDSLAPEQSNEGLPDPVEGPDALSYVDNAGTLHVRPYDGNEDAPLESGISSIFNVSIFYASGVLR